MNRLIFKTIALCTCVCCAGSFAAKKPVALSEKEVRGSYAAFHKALYDPERKVYWRDTDRGPAIAVGWTQAILWDIALNAYKKTGSQEYLDLIGDLYEGNCATLAGFDWTVSSVWDLYDDMMWWVISFARGYQITGEARYLEHATAGFERIWHGLPQIDPKGSFDREGGGMYWDWKFGRRGKMACINYPTVIAAVTLYHITQQPNYLSRAKEVYAWSRANLFDATTGAVADSKHDGNRHANWAMTLYNQGTCLGSGVMLYGATGEKTYLDDAILATEYVKGTMCDENGIFPVEVTRRLKNPPTLDEKGIYRAIFAEYIEMLIADCGQAQYRQWIVDNAAQGWANRDSKRGITAKNFREKTSATQAVSSYDASGIPALMWSMYGLE